MKVKELQQILKDLNPDTDVVIEGAERAHPQEASHYLWNGKLLVLYPAEADDVEGDWAEYYDLLDTLDEFEREDC